MRCGFHGHDIAVDLEAFVSPGQVAAHDGHGRPLRKGENDFFKQSCAIYMITHTARKLA